MPKSNRLPTGIFAQDYPSLPQAVRLLDAMQAHPIPETARPSSIAIAFISRIEQADPNSLEISEDNTNANWGHSQFTAGKMTCRSVLTSWDSIGNTSTACRL